jgi:DNA polymerase-3 subunit gamma/tau
MSYVVLARKYRPRRFEDMVGQDHVVRALTHALEQQRLHHAYLFTGTRGIGKTTVSRILAKSLNCTGPDGQGGITARPCGVCSACREIDADRYIDYVELDAASNRSIDEVRDLIERAAYKPTVGRFKVFMIDESHQLTKDAFNALLKTLEEPPEYLKFVLATTDPEKMLPTVLSRCLQFNLRPMAPVTVAEYLAQVLGHESIEAEPGALRLLSRAARGSMRDALSLTDQAIAYGGGRLQEAGVRAMLGAVDRRHAEHLIGALAARDGRAVLETCEGLRAQGLSAAGTLEEMARLLQQMAVHQAVPGALDATDSDAEAATRLASVLRPDETQLLYSICLHGRAELHLAPDEYAGLVMVLLRFMAFPSAAGPVSGSPASGAAGGGAGHHERGASGASVSGAAASPVVAAPLARPVATPTPTPAPVVSAPPSVPVPAPVAALVPAPAPVATAPSPAPAAPSSEPATPPAEPAKPLSAAARLVAQAQARAQARAASRPAEPDAAADDGPPPWMDEAPPEDGYDFAAADTGDDDLPMPRASATPPAASAPAAPAARAERIEVKRTPSGDRWAEVVAALTDGGKVVALVRELALQAELQSVDCDVWRLVVERESLRAQPLLEKLQAQVREVLNQATLRLEAVAGVAQDSPARREAELTQRRQWEAEEVFQGDPLVRGLLARFDSARIVAGSIRPQ